ncbi:MAG: endonuclease V [Methanoculleaceae archaeon]
MSDDRLRSLQARAVRVQQRMRECSPYSDVCHLSFPHLIGGADVAYFDDRAFGAVVTWNATEGRIVDRAVASTRTAFPYIPGCFSFREGPAIMKAWRGLSVRPDLLLFHGHGTAHPERFGLACHIGMRLNVPSAGVAGRLLVGTAAEPGPVRRDTTPIYHQDEVVGVALRTRTGVRPVYVSPGYRTSLEDAVSIVLLSCRGYRMPEPLRLAHHHATTARNNASAGVKSTKNSPDMES